MASPLATISLIANVALLALLAISTVRQPTGDSRLDIESHLMVRQQSAALDLQRVMEQMGRVNKQLKENIGVMGIAKSSLQEALVLEELRGVPADEARGILHAAQGLVDHTDDKGVKGQGDSTQEGADGESIGLQKAVSERPGLKPKREAMWLTIGIPTVARPGGEDYLTRTLQTLLDELPLDVTDPLYSNVRVVVMNMAGKDHAVFENIKKRFEKQLLGDTYAKKAPLYIEMMERPGLCRDPIPDATEPDPTNNPSDTPGRVARKQTCDVLDLMAASEGSSHYFMFMEDDFETCPHALQMLQYALRKLNTGELNKNWLALRVSYGMNGVVLRNADMRRFSEFVRENMTRKPVDLLWQEYALHSTEHAAILTRGRDLHIYRFNLFAHIGDVSSFPGRPPRKAWPQCYEFMTRAWSLQQNEQFDPKCLDSSDFTPCKLDKTRSKGPDSSSDELRRWVNSKLNRPNV